MAMSTSLVRLTSLTAILSAFAGLGIGYAILRFWPSLMDSPPSGKFNTAALVIAVVAPMVGGIVAYTKQRHKNGNEERLSGSADR